MNRSRLIGHEDEENAVSRTSLHVLLADILSWMRSEGMLRD